jgi:hypothetical protein
MQLTLTTPCEQRAEGRTRSPRLTAYALSTALMRHPCRSLTCSSLDSVHQCRCAFLPVIVINLVYLIINISNILRSDFSHLDFSSR